MSTVVNADNFALYGGGILNLPACSKSMNHAVLAVGYGSANGQDFWIIKNSWSADFGEHGYIRMSRNKAQQCSISNWSSYPRVS